MVVIRRGHDDRECDKLQSYNPPSPIKIYTKPTSYENTAPRIGSASNQTTKSQPKAQGSPERLHTITFAPCLYIQKITPTHKHTNHTFFRQIRSTRRLSSCRRVTAMQHHMILPTATLQQGRNIIKESSAADSRK